MLFLGNGGESEAQALDLINQLEDALSKLSSYQQMGMLGPDLQGTPKERVDKLKNDIHRIRNHIYNALTVDNEYPTDDDKYFDHVYHRFIVSN